MTAPRPDEQDPTKRPLDEGELDDAALDDVAGGTGIVSNMGFPSTGTK